ncbi:hypothetical protein BLNAU_4204 [Blattamonas nauphoetae]|uniref:Uncharacterized protein n=1 Tax=Blattamonas nauphoetae TaxID=2049346 RepID=A0ABQ9YAK4_9EUKA|nr:hypothetical protein BLNAU_4204 [Blattamonas nauphoetae]
MSFGFNPINSLGKKLSRGLGKVASAVESNKNKKKSDDEDSSRSPSPNRESEEKQARPVSNEPAQTSANDSVPNVKEESFPTEDHPQDCATEPLAFPAEPPETSYGATSGPSQSTEMYDPPTNTVPASVAQTEEGKPDNQTKNQKRSNHKDSKSKKGKGYTLMEREKHCFGFCSTNYYLFSILCCILIWTGVILIIIGAATKMKVILYVGVGLAVVCYISTVSESCRGSHNHALKKVNYKEGFLDIIEEQHQKAPQLVWTCESYHFDIGTRSVTENYYDLNGVRQIRQKQELCKEAVITHSARFDVPIRRWEDTSENIADGIRHYYHINADIQSVWDYADDGSCERATQMKEMFLAEHRDKDKYFEWAEHYVVPDFRTDANCLVDRKNRPLCMNRVLYAGMMLITIPFVFRMWVDRRTLDAKFKVEKTLYV